MQDLRKAAQQALDDLEYFAECGWESDAIATLRAALGADTRTCTCHPDDSPPKPCQRKYALSECLDAALAEDRSADTGKTSDHFPDAGKMEATSQESRQVDEPVAWLIESYDIYAAKRTLQRLVFDNPKNMQGVKITAYYTAPPKRKPINTDMILATWVEECIPKRSTPELIVAFARAIERAAHGIGGEE